jgi:hypothetical protein
VSGPLASFRDLKGIGPATEARLHEAGIYSWEALAAAATALAAVRGEGETLRDVAQRVAELRGGTGDQSAPRIPGSEHLEAFVLRMALTADGVPLRSTMTHVRTMTEQAWAGWTPADLVRFVEEHSGVRLPPAPEKLPAVAEPAHHGNGTSPPSPRRRATAAAPPSRQHLVVIDAGKAIGGASRDIELAVADSRAKVTEFDYRATLAARPLGAGANGGEGWTTVAGHAGTSHPGTGSPAHELALRFPGVRLPPGIQRLQLRLEVKLAAPARQPPALALADPDRTP